MIKLSGVLNNFHQNFQSKTSWNSLLNHHLIPISTSQMHNFHQKILAKRTMHKCYFSKVNVVKPAKMEVQGNRKKSVLESLKS